MDTLAWIILAGVSAAIGVALAIVGIIQLWRMRKARFSELIATLGQIWDSKLLTEARQLVNKLADEGKLKATMDEADRTNSEEFFIYGNALSAIDLEGVSHFKKLIERFQR